MWVHAVRAGLHFIGFPLGGCDHSILSLSLSLSNWLCSPQLNGKRLLLLHGGVAYLPTLQQTSIFNGAPQSSLYFTGRPTSPLNKQTLAQAASSSPPMQSINAASALLQLFTVHQHLSCSTPPQLNAPPALQQNPPPQVDPLLTKFQVPSSSSTT